MYVKLKDSVISVYKQLQPEIDLGILCSVHYVKSACFFLFLSVVPITFDVAKSPIVCLTEMSEKFQKAVESYCYIKGKFSFKLQFDSFVHNVERDLPEFVGTGRNNHGYYVWVSAVLFLCFVSTSLGRIIYAALSGPLLGEMVNHMKLVKVVKKKEEEGRADETEDSTVSEVLSLERLETDAAKWTLSFLILEVSNWLTVLAQIHLINILLKGKFLSLGFYVWDEVILNIIFPKQVKCDFFSFGPSGTLQNHDILCILVNNLANEKIFLATWFWLMFLTVVSCLSLARRIVSMFCYRNTCFNNIYWRVTRVTGPQKNKMLFFAILKHLSYCEWLFLTYVNDNSEPYVFQEWLKNLAKELGVMKIGKNEARETLGVVTEESESSRHGTEENNANENEENEIIVNVENHSTASAATVLLHYDPTTDNTTENLPSYFYSSWWNSITSLFYPTTGAKEEIELNTLVCVQTSPEVPRSRSSTVSTVSSLSRLMKK